MRGSRKKAGLFLVLDKAGQEGDVDLACRLLMSMVEQAARAPGVDMTCLCCCLLRPKWSTAPHGVPGLMLRAEFYGRATANLIFGVCKGSVHTYKRNVIGCSEPSILPFIIAKLACSWLKRVPTVVLQLRFYCRELTHTCACDSLLLWQLHSGSLPWWTSSKGSVPTADKCH
jgi:hypothetical protein